MLPALGYARQLAAQVGDAGGGALRAGYLHGSAALGGWNAERSDVDILFIAADGIGENALRAVAGVLRSAGPACPGRGLECSVVGAIQAQRPAPPWPFLLHAAATPDGMDEVWGRGHQGDPDLLMHYAVARASGITLAGPAAAECIGPVPRPVILAYLAGEMDWGPANAPESYAVLNACRALVFLREGRIVSKVAGGLEALQWPDFRPVAAATAGPEPTQFWPVPAGLIRQALDQQSAAAPERPPGAEAREFAERVGAALRLAASTEPAAASTEPAAAADGPGGGPVSRCAEGPTPSPPA
jgi:aminoglycoside adenylyltransferase-like protein